MGGTGTYGWVTTVDGAKDPPVSDLGVAGYRVSKRRRSAWLTIRCCYHSLPANVQAFIRYQLELQLVDVHVMLRLPIKEYPGLLGGFNLSATQVLLSVVSGVSVVVYDPSALTSRGDRGKLFKNFLIDHYPWSQEEKISGARLLVL